MLCILYNCAACPGKSSRVCHRYIANVLNFNITNVMRAPFSLVTTLNETGQLFAHHSSQMYASYIRNDIKILVSSAQSLNLRKFKTIYNRDQTKYVIYILQQFVWLGSNYRRCKKKAPKCPTFKRRKRSYPNYSVINIERMDGNKIFISRRVALGSLTLPTLGNSPTLPKAILRLVPGPVLLAVQARPSISRNSSPLPFVPSHSLSLSLV